MLVVLLAFPCAASRAQSKDGTKTVPGIPPPATIVTPAERDRLRAQLKELDEGKILENLKKGRLAEARAGLDQRLHILERLYHDARFPKGEKGLELTLAMFALTFQARGEHGIALDYYRKSMDAAKQLPGDLRTGFLLEIHPALQDEGSRLSEKGEHALAERYFRLLVESLDMMVPPRRDNRQHRTGQGMAWVRLSQSLVKQRKFTEAIDGYRRALDIFKELVPKNDDPHGNALIATATHDLGDALLRAGRSREAAETLRTALGLWRKAFSEKTHPNGHPEIVGTLAELGLALFDQSDFDAAEAVDRDYLVMARRLSLDGDARTAACLCGLGEVLRAKGNFKEAESYIRQSLMLCQQLYPRRKHPTGHPEIAAALCQLGILYSDRGDDAEAMRHLRQALETEIRGETAAETLNNAAVILSRSGEDSQAKDYAALALAFSEKLYPRDKFPQGHRVLATSMMRLASVKWSPKFVIGNDREAAGKLYDNALKMLETLYPAKDYPCGSPVYAECLWRSALHRVRWRFGGKGGKEDDRQGEEFSRRSLEMLNRLYPADRYPEGHPNLASGLLAAGSVLIELGDFTRATGYLHRGIAMMERVYGRTDHPLGHPSLALAYYESGYCWVCRGTDYPRAWYYLRRSMEMYQRLTAAYVSGASEAESLNYQASRPEYLELMLSIAHLMPGADEILYEGFFERKSAVYRATRRRQQFVRESTDAEVRELGRKLTETRRWLARRLLLTASRDELRGSAVKELSLEKEKLEREIAERLPRDRVADSPHGMVEELKKSLPPGTAFIDIYSIRQYWRNPLRNGRVCSVPDMYYLAFVVRPDAPPTRVELPGRFPLDSVTRRWRGEIEGNPPPQPKRKAIALFIGRGVSLQMGNVDYRADHRVILQEDGVSQLGNRDQTLRAIVWEPIERELGPGTTTVIIAPEGQLARMPWAALLGKKPGRVLLEDYTIGIVPNGFVLLNRLPNGQNAGTKTVGLFLGIGDVRYGTVPARAGSTSAGGGTISVQQGSRPVFWRELPGTRTELEAISASAGSRETLLLRQDEPSTDRVRTDLPRARWAHLATHGYFADLDSPAINPFALDLKNKGESDFSQTELSSAGMMPRERLDVLRRNPEAFSCIVLAGANRPPVRGTDGTPRDDGGILSAESIGSLSLQDLELVVLSACETGLGEIAEGEGLLGLQRAFHTAGTTQVASSLWRVDDTATAALMRVFYHKLWVESKPPIVAMREAQLALYYHPERTERFAKLRGPDFAREIDLAGAIEASATTAERRAPTKQWAAFTISGPPPADPKKGSNDPVDATHDQHPKHPSDTQYLGPTRSQSTDADTHVRFGIAYHQEAKLSAAIHEYREAIRLKPDLAEAYFYLGFALDGMKLSKEAGAEWEQAFRLKEGLRIKFDAVARTEQRAAELLAGYFRRRMGQIKPDFFGKLMDMTLPQELGEEAYLRYTGVDTTDLVGKPGCAEDHLALGTVLNYAGDYDGAIKECREAIRLKPQLAEAHFKLGDAFSFKGDHRGAIACAREAIRLEPDYADAHFWLGRSLIQLRDFDGAIAAFREVVRLKPDHPEAYYWLSIALGDQGHPDEARKAWREAFRLDPDIGQTLTFRHHFEDDDVVKLERRTSHFDRGKQLFDQGKSDEALAEWREPLKADPGSVQAHAILGLGLLQKGHLDEAIAEFRDAVRLDPGSAEYLAYLGDALYAKGQSDQAIASYQKAIQFQPDLARAYVGLGMTLWEWKGDHKGAEAAARTAIGLKKLEIADASRAHNCLGNALLGQQRFDEALVSYREAARLQPDAPEPHANIGNLCSMKGQLEDAAQECRESIRLAPKFAEGHAILGQVLIAQKNQDEGIKELREAIRLKPTLLVPRGNLGNALRKAGRLDEAIEEYQKAIRLSPGVAYFHGMLGETLASRGRLEEAVTSFRESVRLEPRQATSYFWLGQILDRLRRFDEAIAAYREGIRLEPDSGEAHHQLGHVLQEQGKGDEATEHFRKAVRFEPNSTELHHDLGHALADQRKPEEAIAHFREALRIKPDYAEFSNDLGNTLNDLGKNEEAITAYLEAIRLKSDFVEAHTGLGRALAGQGKLNEAIATFREVIRLKPNEFEGHSALGQTLAQLHRFAEAIPEFQEVIRLKPDLPDGHCMLGFLFMNQGNWEAAVASLRKARTLAGSEPLLVLRVDSLLERVQTLAALASRLPGVLERTDRPANAPEAASFGEVASLRSRYTVSARLYADAFTADSRLADDLKAGHRYNAACSAALAGCGQGKDDPAPDEAGRAKLRRQALDWLRADLILRNRQLDSGKPEAVSEVSQILSYWKTDSDLAGVRGSEALVKLPDDEQKAWRALWAEVAALEKKAQGNRP